MLFELENEWHLFEGIVEEVIGEYIDTDVFGESPIEKIPIEESDILPFNQDSLPFIFLLFDISVLDTFFIELRRELFVLSGYYESGEILLLLSEEVDESVGQ